MPVVAQNRPVMLPVDQDRPPRMAGLLYGLLLSIPLWAAILAVVL